MKPEEDYWVTVCRNCCKAICWHGEIMCYSARHAGTIEMRASELRRRQIEHEDNYSRERLRVITGQEPKPVTEPQP